VGAWFYLFFSMATKTKQTPAQVADEYEMHAQQSIDNGDRIMADLYMSGARAIRQALRALARLDHRVHAGYDFNADPDGITREVGESLANYKGDQ